MGASVVLVEKGRMGGDCLNYGCVPSKSLLAAAHAAQVVRTRRRLWRERPRAGDRFCRGPPACARRHRRHRPTRQRRAVRGAGRAGDPRRRPLHRPAGAGGGRGNGPAAPGGARHRLAAGGPGPAGHRGRALPHQRDRVRPRRAAGAADRARRRADRRRARPGASPARHGRDPAPAQGDPAQGRSRGGRGRARHARGRGRRPPRGCGGQKARAPRQPHRRRRHRACGRDCGRGQPSPAGDGAAGECRRAEPRGCRHRVRCQGRGHRHFACGPRTPRSGRSATWPGAGSSRTSPATTPAS